MLPANVTEISRDVAQATTIGSRSHAYYELARPRAIQRPNSTTALVIRRPTIAPIVGTRSALVRLEIAEMDTASTHYMLAGHFNCSPLPSGSVTHGIDSARPIYKAL